MPQSPFIHSQMKNCTWKEGKMDTCYQKNNEWRYGDDTWLSSKNSFVCGKHFIGGKKQGLFDSPSYLPTILPDIYKKKPLPVNASDIRLQIKERQVFPSNMETIEEFCHMLPSNNDLPTADAMTQTGDDRLNMNNCSGMVVNTFVSVHYGNDVAVQADISMPSGKDYHCKNRITKECASGPDTEGETNVATAKGFMGFTHISNEEQMKQLAGVSLSIFSNLLLFLKPTGKNFNPTSFEKLTKENRLLLTLVKLKLGLAFDTLSCVFLTTPKTVLTIFYQTLHTLLINMSNWIYWPSQQVVQSVLPKRLAIASLPQKLAYR